MRSNSSQRGDGRLSFVFWLVVLVAGGVVGFEVVPVRYKMAELQDFMVSTAERARIGNERQLRNAILYKAKELDLPLTDKALAVSIAGGRVKIDAEYTITLDFMVYTWDWHKKHEINRAIYYW